MIWGMKINLEEGLLHPVRFLPSPHWDERPAKTIIDMVVIHAISLPPGQWTPHYIEQFFCNQLDVSAHDYFKTIASLRVAAHLLIDRQGQITQFVPFIKRAWHAGHSCFEGRSNCNDFSIGIELIGTDEIAFEDSQYRTLAEVLHLLMIAYPAIRTERIQGHSDIAPGRKTDPGPFFDWTYLKTLLSSHIGNTV